MASLSPVNWAVQKVLKFFNFGGYKIFKFLGRIMLTSFVIGVTGFGNYMIYIPTYSQCSCTYWPYFHD